MAGLTVLDASVLIAQLDTSDRHHALAVEWLMGTAGTLGASVVSVAEVLVGPTRAGRLEEALRALAVLEVLTMPLDAASGPRLAELRVDTGLKLPDCCVLLAAVTAQAERLLTLDQRLARAAAARGLDTQPPRAVAGTSTG